MTSRPPRKPKEPMVMLAVRVTADQLERIDRLVARLERPGVLISRSDAMRAALMAGLDRLLEEAPEGR